VKTASLSQSARLALAICIALAGLCTDGIARDTIVVVDDNTGETNRFEGQVVSWDSDELVYINNGRERELPARRVVAVEYLKHPQHLEAEQLFSEGRLDQAFHACDQAIEAESRRWVTEELLAMQVRCSLGAGSAANAIACFVRLRELAPRSRFGHLIPLAWGREPGLDRLLEESLRKWLDGDDAALSLVAASWLYTADESACRERLRQLQSSADRTTAQFAAAQLWRGELVVATTADLARWQALIERMPEPFQAGPRLLAAIVQKRLTGDDKSVIALLQVPVLFPDELVPAAEALREAAELLGKLGRNAEAAIVLNELKSRYSMTSAATREFPIPEQPRNR
jgi:tetratricopeptide (TPR) repeat protein